MSRSEALEAEARAREPLLEPQQRENGGDAEASEKDVLQKQEEMERFGLRDAFQVLHQMIKMALPLLLNLMASYGINIVTLAFVGHVGTTELAAAALGMSLVGIVGRTVLFGLTGALDTLASQAYGAGNMDALGWHFRTAVSFLLAHAVPLCAILTAAPMLLRQGEGQGQDGAALADMAGKYVLYMLPALFIECIDRPLNSMLVAQRITLPQMTVQLVVLPLHAANNYVFIHVLKMGYVGAALAYVCSNAYVLVMLSSYVWCSRLGYRVWGGTRQHASVWQAWTQFARLSYPACLMRCAESWAFSLMTLAAGRLPSPGISVAAVSVSFNLYGILYMLFAAFAITTVTQVGNALGSGSATRARNSALTALCAAPFLWMAVAAVLLEPHSQRALELIFTDGKDPELMSHLRRMLVLVAALELLDGSQLIMAGVIQGAGKQKLGVLVNVVAFYVFAIPTALGLAFYAGWGIEGMYTGMLIGPAMQAAAYAHIIARMDWRQEAARVAARAARVREEREAAGGDLA